MVSSLSAVQADASPDGTTDYVPIRGKKYDMRKPHIADQQMTWQNWPQHINWLNTTLIIFIPILGMISAYWVSLQWKTAVFSTLYYIFAALGITAGYHRLWAHTSYKATLPLKIFLAAAGAAAVEGSIRWWSREHRAHHRYTDTEADPYSVRKGLLYSHIGWMVFKQNPRRIGRTDITDLNEDSIVIWQHKNYLTCVIIMTLVVPTIICGLFWGDFLGGFVYAGILRTFCLQQATFCVNSLAHWLGDQPFDNRNSPRNHVITALITLGEGYHNFHHEFPSDYRNAIKWYQYDPTKWAIWTWKQLGLAYDLQKFRQNEIEKGYLQQQQTKLDQRRIKLDWGTPLQQLPVIHWDDFIAMSNAKNGKALITIAGVIYDVTRYINEHPGGKALITSAIGKDATATFNGGIYQHGNVAHNLLSTMRVGVLRGGCEVEVWKRGQAATSQHSVRARHQLRRVAQPLASDDAA
ncbi:putative Acyl-CoA desaturase [Seiridium unicorne]|uniref:Acyl-CoA desaturase n=1 Tax=Seiridium unicorne TaxID=138068 RepID=A0ABR2VA02_9PEZI